jgi:hypothetical protein
VPVFVVARPPRFKLPCFSSWRLGGSTGWTSSCSSVSSKVCAVQLSFTQGGSEIALLQELKKFSHSQFQCDQIERLFTLFENYRSSLYSWTTCIVPQYVKASKNVNKWKPRSPILSSQDIVCDSTTWRMNPVGMMHFTIRDLDERIHFT